METRIHPETGEILHRDVRLIEFSFKGEKFTVNMPGWYPAEGDEGIFTHEDLKVSERALANLRARHEKISTEDTYELSDLSFA